MNKTELINVVAEQSGLTKTAAAKAVDATFNAIANSLAAGEAVKVPSFGTFEVRHREERSGYNPHTQEKIVVPACNAPAFKPAKALKNKC